VNAVNEPKRVDCGAPDFQVFLEEDDEPLSIGYVETKDIGAPLDRWEQDEQIKRYKEGLDNLVLTNYLEFRWFVEGERRAVASLGTMTAGKREINIDRKAKSSVTELLESFLSHSPKPVGRASDLTARMARITKSIRDIVQKAFEKKLASQNLTELFDSFKDTIIRHLEVRQFANMFAQTLAYGLFAARYNQMTGSFRLSDAAHNIPRTNPFLRNIFHLISGPDLEREPFAGYILDFAGLLSKTDMSSVLEDFGRGERQEDPIFHFYETFLAAYDPEERERRGVYYTPSSVISYIVRSVDTMLKERFGCRDGLADSSRISGDRDALHRVLVLDPACGTGSFLYRVVIHIRDLFAERNNAGQWSEYVRDNLLPRLFGFELMMAPYAVAHLKIEMELEARDMTEAQRRLWACDLSGVDRLGIYLTNSLEPTKAIGQTIPFSRFISDEANAAADIKGKLPIMVVLGNPPYSGHSATKSERGMSRLWIEKLVDDYKWVDGLPLGERNPKWLQDDYVKFIRFGQWRIEQTGAGVLAFITNHAYLDNPTFRGMRQKLMKSFDDIYILNLHGNAKKRERCPDGSKDENVFDIQQGVAIGIFIRNTTPPSDSRGGKLNAPPAIAGGDTRGGIHYADLWGMQAGKDRWLEENDIKSTEWQTLDPSSPFYLFIPQDTSLRDEYYSYPSITDIMPVHSVGIVTARDNLTIAFTKEELKERLEEFVRLEKEEARERFELGKDSSDWEIEWAQKDVEEHGIKDELIVPILCRPFDIRYTFYSGRTHGLHCRPRPKLMRHMIEIENIGIIASRIVKYDNFGYGFVSTGIVNGSLMASNTCSSTYLYPSYANDYNLSSRFVKNYKNILNDKIDVYKILKYIYSIFYSHNYRERYYEFLRLDFPRIPITSDRELFDALTHLGGELIDLHLLNSELLHDTGISYPVRGSHLVDRGFPKFVAPGEKDLLTGEALKRGRVYINKEATPPYSPPSDRRGGSMGSPPAIAGPAPAKAGGGDNRGGGQHFDGVPPEVWQFHIGGYQVCQKWLKDRRGRMLSGDDIEHYKKVVKAIAETIRIMREIDRVIPGWPLP